MPDNKRVFQTRKSNNRIITFIVTFIVTTILTFFLVQYLFWSFGVNPQVCNYFGYIIPVLIGIAVGIAFVFADRQIIIEIDDESFIYTKGSIVERYSLSAFAGSNVVKNYMNGGYIGSDRYIRFVRPDGTIRQIAFPFGEEEFSDLVSMITKNRRTNEVEDCSEYSKEVRGSFEGGKRIEVPKEDFLRVFEKSYRIRGVISIIIILLSIAVCIGSFIMLDLWFFFGVAVFFGFLGPAFAALVYFFGRKETKQALHDTPSFVLVEPTVISFEKDIYDSSDIKMIVVSPSAYKSIQRNSVEFRTIEIVDRMGNRHKYCFGSAPKDNKKMVFEGYPELVNVLDTWSYANSIEFRLDLG